MDFALSRPLRELAAEAEDVARAAALSLPFPEASWLIGFDRSFTEQLGKRGWIGMTWPIEDGGHGRTALERFVVYEQLIRHGAPICAGYFADRQMGPSLLQFGTPAQRKRWLPGIVAGTSMWCIGMSEPDAGSDVGSARTRADRDGDDWIVNGNKVWTSGAAHADWCYCVVRTDSSAAKHAGLSDLVIDMRSPGISVHPIKDMTASEHFCEVNFTDVRVPGSNLVGKENSSFRQLMRQLEHERGGIDRLLSNYALYTAVRSMIDPATTRDPVVRQELAHIEAGYRIGRNLVLREVLQQAPHGFSAATKLFCTELEVQIANVVARLLGPAAMLWGPDSGLGGRAAREVCYAPSYRIMGGTAEILRNIIGERVLGLPR